MKFRFTALIAIVAVGLVLKASGLFAEETSHDPKSLGYIKGYSWGWTGWRGSYAAPEAEESLGKLADTGTEWVCIAFAPNMQTFDTPEFLFGDANPDMITDAELRRTFDVARAKGLKPMLKPVVNSADDVWRAWIRFFRPITAEERAAGITGEHDPYGESPKFREGEVKDLAKWDQWWDDYTNYIVHYAKIAEEKQVPVLCLGCEMNSTEEFADKWRNLIAKVRDVYHGQITYDVNHGNEEKVAWFDALDFISLSAYYPIPGADGQVKETPSAETTSVEEIRAAMVPVRDHLAKVSAKWGKPILFIEAGVTPVRGCARTPWVHVDERADWPNDEQEQANFYQAMFETFSDEPWFMGWCWWDWPAQLYDESAAANDRSFCVYGKKAEGVLREWYAKPRSVAETK
jgi:Glycoside Hydrolase Family 113